MTTRRRWLRGLAGMPAAAAWAQTPPRETVHDVIRALAAEAPLEMEFRGRTEWQCRLWQRQFARKLADLLGPHQPPPEWRTETENEVVFADHKREALVLHAKGHPSLPVYRLSPAGSVRANGAGIVAVHGHGAYGYDAVAGIDDTPEKRESIAKANYDYGRQLVRLGYVVVAPCLTPFGRRLGERKAYGGDDPCAVTFVRLQLLGKVLMAENRRDVLWSLALLAATSGVNPDRLGCVGLSYGGRMTMLATALEPRFRVAVIAGALNVMQERISVRYSCGAQVIPGLLRYGDVPEIGSLIAPRPCLWEVGDQDPLMKQKWVEVALERMRRAYRACGMEKNLRVDRFEGGHRWDSAPAEALLGRVLL